MLIKVKKTIDDKEITELQLSTERVIFEDNGVQKEKIIGNEGKQWWLDLSDKHDNKAIIGFEPVSYEQDVIDRLEEIKSLDLDLGLAEKYVMDGEEIKEVDVLKLRQELKSTQEALDFLVMNGGL